MEVSDFGSSKSEKHIIALEEIVDNLKEENKRLKEMLRDKPPVISQEAYDLLCALYQKECTKNLPF